MLYAIDKKNCKLKNRGESFYEDVKTSFIIGGLLLLPDDIIGKIFNSVGGGKLPKDFGDIVGYEFWPQWKDINIKDINIKDKTLKSREYVEPDVFIQFEKCDVIIEVKRTGHEQQTKEQWLNELVAYDQKFGNNKDVYLIALGGYVDEDETLDKIKERWNIEESDIEKYMGKVCRCSWDNLKNQIKEYENYRDDKSWERLMEQINLSFQVCDFYEYRWFEQFNPQVNIAKETINEFKELRDEFENGK